MGVIIVAAGSSQRLGTEDKIFSKIKHRPLLSWSGDVCQACNLVKQIIIVLNTASLEQGKRLIAERGWSKATTCLGGVRRQDSVQQGLSQVEDCNWVMVHDASRPFITQEMIHNGLDAAQETGAAVAAIPVTDTIKLTGEGNVVRETPPRNMLWSAQTPQIFRYDILRQAYDKLTTNITDDATAVEQIGYTVKLYMGSYRNIKVSTPEDLALAEVIA